MRPLAAGRDPPPSRVLIVAGAHRVDIDFTHVSMWERLIAFSGRFPNGTGPVARSAFARVDGT